MRHFDFMRSMRQNGPIDLTAFETAIDGSSVRSSKRRNEVLAKAKPYSKPIRVNPDRELQQQTDDYNKKVQGTDDWRYEGDNDNPFGFDATQYSLRFLRCAEVKQFDDELAASEDSKTVFSTKHFVVFRFCPAATCVVDEEEVEAEAEEAEQAEAQANQRKQFGGCDSNYGEYMLELGDYLEIMADYHEEHFSTYCEYCEQCMLAEYYYWLKKNGRDLENDERELDAYFDDAYVHTVCPEYENCKTYQDVCNGDEYNNGDFDFTDYFECTEFTKKNGKTAFIGPHCAADGETVLLGVYSDAYCSEYIGHSVDIENFMGIEMNNDTLKEYYNSDLEPCIPCRAADQLYLDIEQFSKYTGNKNYKNEYDDDGEGINELCTTLYQSSARCDQHFRSYNRLKYTYYNVDQMKLSCDFIESVINRNYDEFGFIKLSQNASTPNSWLQSSVYYQEYGHYVQEVTPGQIFGLCVSILACAILGLWSWALNRSLSKKGPWRPRLGLRAMSPPNANVAAPITRQDSGIVMGRSRSGASFYVS